MSLPLLERLGAALDEDGVTWTVLREESGPRFDDVALRIGPEAAGRAAGVLHGCGFARVAGRYLAPVDDGRWVRVEVVGVPRAGGPVRAALARVVARLRPARGMTVALLGPDGVGKSTLVAGLAAAYPLPVRQVYMGMWQGADTPGHTRLDAVVAILVRPLRVWWRVAVAAVHAARGRLVVFDRYTYDAMLPITGSLRWLKRPYFWVLAHLAPRPDLVLVLDLPGEVAFARKGEFTPEGLEAVRQGFLALAPRVRAEVVDASLPAEQVRRDVVSRIWRRHRGRLTHA